MAVATASGPWHAGERTLQERFGVADRMEKRGPAVIRDHLIAQHRAFFPRLSFVVLGTVDPAGDAWATLRFGKPGFAHALDEKTLHLAVPPDGNDPAEAGLDRDKAVGLLGIEFSTRRRNRMNGTIGRRNPSGLDIRVEQSFGNCPQYIRIRSDCLAEEGETAAGPVHAGDGLDDAARALVREADTFFVASYADPEDACRQVDVSHRGGKPGFVRLDEGDVLTIPDFAGNLFFNTLGNILINPRAGLLFIDFETGDMLHLTGEARVVLEGPDIAAFQGAERLWTFKPTRMVRRTRALPIRWQAGDDSLSPNALLTGSWDDARKRIEAMSLRDGWRPFRVTNIVDESDSVRSFHLSPMDGAGSIPAAAGQHLPIRVTIPGRSGPRVRTYTLSSAPASDHYRISVKRDGLVSRHLHESVDVGDHLEVRSPTGAFTMDTSRPRPAVLLAAGIGITPMVAMLHHIVSEGARTRRTRPTWLFYAARTVGERAFSEELRTLASASQGTVRLIRLLSDPTDAVEDTDYDRSGHIDMPMLSATLPFDDYDFYLCGPAAFMQSMYDGLRSLNIADERIHAETFGPSSFRRDGERPPRLPQDPVSTEPVLVTFARSGKQAIWHPGGGSLLDLAEGLGLAPIYGCRSGHCGSCPVPVRAGTVAYETKPSFDCAPGEALICRALPGRAHEGARETGLTLDL